MAGYKYLLPLISICPPEGYRLHQSIPMKSMGDLIDQPKMDVRITRSLVLGDRALVEQEDIFEFRDSACDSQAARFEIEPPISNQWREGGPLAYLETQFEILGSGQFARQFPPDFYTIYAAPERKSFFSDNALKYGNTVTILQIQAFGAWVEGYPTSMVDLDRDIDESVVLINPFLKPAVVDIALEGIDKKVRARIEAQSGRRISLADAFDLSDQWAGQVYVSGRNRVVMFVAKHSAADPSMVTTLEHSNPYRGEPTHLPLSQLLRQKIGTALRFRR